MYLWLISGLMAICYALYQVDYSALPADRGFCFFLFFWLTQQLWPISISFVLLLSMAQAKPVMAKVLSVGWLSFWLLSILASYQVADKLNSRLPLEQDGMKLLMQVEVSSDIRENSRGAKLFEIDVHNIVSLDDSVKVKRLALSWYPPFAQNKRNLWQIKADQLAKGQLLEVEVKLRAIRNFYNPGSFDYEAYMLYQGIDARGYIKQLKILKARRQTHEQAQTSLFDLEKLREEQLDFWQSQQGSVAYLIPALVFGDSSNIPADLWHKLRSLGAVHLIVVSGLHLGLMAVMTLFLLRLVTRLLAVIKLSLITNQLISNKGLHCKIPINRSYLEAILLILIITLYAAITGWGVSVQRAWLMVVMVIILQQFFIRLSIWQLFLCAMLVVLVLNPMSLSQIGFVFSFACVACLLLAFSGKKGTDKNNARDKPLMHALKSTLIGGPQWVVFLAAAALMPMFVLPWSVSQLLFNLAAVPLVAFIVLPASLLLAVILWLIPDLDLTFLIDVFNYLTDGLWQLAGVLLANPTLSKSLAMQQLAWFEYFGLAILVALTLQPLLKNVRIISLLILWLLVCFYQEKPQLNLAFLDVGQGLAVMLNSQQSSSQQSSSQWNMVFDTGNEFSEKFNFGSAVVAPAIKRLGGKEIGLLVVSHSDRDHSAGEKGLAQHFNIKQRIYGQPSQSGALSHASSCHQLNDSWRQAVNSKTWQIDYRFLTTSPVPDDSDNNHSCVMQFKLRRSSWPKPIKVLLTGDIEKAVEQKLIAKYGSELKSDILLVAHHGSKTSSTRLFIEQVAPQTAVISAGFNNRFYHPHKSVTRRFKALGIELLNTADMGAVIFQLDQVRREQALLAIRQRFISPKPWQQSFLAP